MYFDIDVYSQIIELELKTISNNESSRPATQDDINIFLL